MAVKKSKDKRSLGAPLTAMFLGAGAKTADLAALKRAKDMAASGEAREGIWKDTGWFQGVDKKWRYEISDSASSLKQSPSDFYATETAKYGHQTQETWLPTILNHKELLAAHPELENARVFVGDQSHGTASAARGAYLGRDFDGNPLIGMSVDASKDTMLHELQHAIQEKEDLARGGEPKHFTGIKAEDALRDLYGRQLSQDGRDALHKSLQRDKDALGYSHALYKRLAGEVEARNVQTRMGMSVAERKATPPWKTQDVPDEQQLIKTSNGPMLSKGAKPVGAKRGTQNEANLKAILENRAAKPKLADLRAKKQSAVALRDQLKERHLGVVAKGSAKHAKQLQTQITTIKKDYASRAEKGQATKANKAKGQETAVKALAAGRDALRAQAKNLGIAGRSKMNMATLRSEVAKAAAKTGSKLGAIAMIAAPITAAALAYDATKSQASAAGLNGKQAMLSATKAAAVAGATTGAVGLSIAGGISLAAKALPLIAKVAGPLAIPFAALGAKQGLEKHGPAGALFGLFGLDDVAAMAKHRAEAVLLTPPSERHESIVPRSIGFAKANATYKAMQDTPSNEDSKLKGWQNPKNQAVIQANRQQRKAG